MNALNRSFFYRGFRKTLRESCGREEADCLWEEAGKRYAALKAENRDIDRDSAMMILPAAALYQTRKALLPLLRTHAERTGQRIGKAVHAVTAIPGVPTLLWRRMPGLMRRMSSPEKGYSRVIVSETPELVGVDILACPLHQAATDLGVPEVASVVCAMDKAYMTGFRHIEYTRTTAIGEGGDVCDYRLRYDRVKK